MSVKLLDNDVFYGYRVRRKAKEKTYQEYFSLKKGGRRINGVAKNKIERQAQKRDDHLAEIQANAKREEKAARCFNSDGTVRGISYLVKIEKSSTLSPIFQVGMASEISAKIIGTCVSINAHGEEGAWRRAIEVYTQSTNVLQRVVSYLGS